MFSYKIGRTQSGAILIVMTFYEKFRTLAIRCTLGLSTTQTIMMVILPSMITLHQDTKTYVLASVTAMTLIGYGYECRTLAKKSFIAD